MVNPLISTSLSDYLGTLVPPRTGELLEMEAYAAEKDFPIIGPICGYLCYQIARIAGAKKVFEMGSGFGYSTAWLARAVKENNGGEVHHVVWDADLSDRARNHLNRLGYEGIVQYHVDEAVQVLRDMDTKFDLIFNDIDKEGYPDSLSVILDHLKPGGILIVDNVLWSGRILDVADTTPSTEAIRELTRRVVSDPRWIATIYPIRDGLLVAYRNY